VGIFGAGAVRFGAGDSAWVAAYIDGIFPAPARPGGTRPDITRGYFGNADLSDPVEGRRTFHPHRRRMSHCYIYQSNLPEARDAYQVIVNFFRENLR
jgi:epsilon-lactone hydrolase